ncbi:MAG: hypothetical protein Q8P44_06390 [Dehalococcoidia bacterium]|nr:hypothetical protein [Dehalococcoidia bacterium]
MTGYIGGQWVEGGFYIKHPGWKMETIAGESGCLPDQKGARYSKVPLPVVMVAGPFVGLAYIIFSPIVFVFAIVYIFVKRIFGKAK